MSPEDRSWLVAQVVELRADNYLLTRRVHLLENALLRVTEDGLRELAPASADPYAQLIPDVAW